MYPAAALMEIVEANPNRQAAVASVLHPLGFSECRQYGHPGLWKDRHISTEDGTKVYEQPRDTWIEVPIPQFVDEDTWVRTHYLKKQRCMRAKRNTMACQYNSIL